MSSSRFTSLAAFAALLTLAVTDPNSVCLSYGVDFVDEGHYFINTNSNESFTCVSTFKGCNNDVADILLVNPSNDEYLCSQVGTTPADTPMLSTCPILKNQMVSGEWIIIVVGNNGDGLPFAWQRDISIDAGPQATTTVTPTVTFSITTTPTVMATSTSTQTIILTTGPFTTITIPSATAQRTQTVTPKPVTTTSTKTFTRTQVTWTNDLQITTKTVTATCTIPGRGRQDKLCTYTPTLVHAAALETPTGKPKRGKYHRYMRRTDRAIDYEYARSRIDAARLKRDLTAKAAPLEERAPDAPTLTVTATTPVNTTVTATAAPVTSVESIIISTTSTSTLPPVTVYSGVFTSTVTLPTPTRTQLAFAYTATTTTFTIHATWTRTTTVTPTASVTPCRSLGGHIGFGRI